MNIDSPLWSIDWVTQLPLNYNADQASSFADMSASYGYDYVTTPMFVNCPDIGNLGDAVLEKSNGFTPYIDTDLNSNWILGSDMSLIFKAGIPISFEVDGTEIASTSTNMMGAYEYELETSEIPEGTTMINVVANGETIRAIEVKSKMKEAMIDTMTDNMASPASNIGAGAGVGLMFFTAILSVSTF